MRGYGGVSIRGLGIGPIQAESAFFDCLAREHGDCNPFADAGWRQLAACFDELVAPRRRIDLLDIGCGTGRSRQIYERHLKRYVGVDLSTESIRIARERFPRIGWRVAEACDLPMADQSFEVVAFSSVLHHIPDKSLALKESAPSVEAGRSRFCVRS